MSSDERARRIRILRTASLAVAGVGASIAMAVLGSWWAPLILLLATAGAVLVIWKSDSALAAPRAVIPVLVVVSALTVAGLLGIAGVLPTGWAWAALGAYAVAWGEYLLSQTVARSRGVTAWR
ncbi:hypothetical protein AB0O16_08425 [Microbacterium sp. NPDC089180]|uniref:Phosphatidate cytidylyltransferase n=1 Tax=Microbacterium galbum TaxID=3075994 RepID=A0ABU3T8T4_9MICO|nr:hypothetical protein [Microbacterium sp. KSW4-17]MDU0367766.1 hypothetical protein [Microbacterium sp. KSW4-17]